MPRRIVFNDPAVGAYVAREAECLYHPGTDATIGIVDDSGVVGGFIYTGNNGRSMSIHTAGEGAWLTRDLMWVMFDFPFNQLGIEKLFGVIAAANAKSLALALHAGFVVEAALDDFFPSGAAYIVAMHRTRCRWLRVTPRAVRSNLLTKGTV